MRLCLESLGKIKVTCILAEKLRYYGESLAEIDLDSQNLCAMTATLIPQYRNVALLANQSATLQEISNGKFRTGAGATHDYATQW